MGPPGVAGPAGPPTVGAPAPAQQPAQDPLAHRRPWDYVPEDKPVDESQIAVAWETKIVESLGSAWLGFGALASLAVPLTFVIFFQIGQPIETPVVILMVALSVAVQELWTFIDIRDRGGAMWWMALTWFFVLFWLYLLIERTDA